MQKKLLGCYVTATAHKTPLMNSRNKNILFRTKNLNESREKEKQMRLRSQEETISLHIITIKL